MIYSVSSQHTAVYIIRMSMRVKIVYYPVLELGCSEEIIIHLVFNACYVFMHNIAGIQ